MAAYVNNDNICSIEVEDNETCLQPTDDNYTSAEINFYLTSASVKLRSNENSVAVKNLIDWRTETN